MGAPGCGRIDQSSVRYTGTHHVGCMKMVPSNMDGRRELSAGGKVYTGSTAGSRTSGIYVKPQSTIRLCNTPSDAYLWIKVASIISQHLA